LGASGRALAAGGSSEASGSLALSIDSGDGLSVGLSSVPSPEVIEIPR